jgi:bidirectional [NiFe] hydrogenase diaphorase subunit
MMARRPTLDVSIDGVETRAYEGESILSAASRAGIRIPTLCWLDGLTPVGGCRMCVVEIAEVHQLRPACATTVADDMEVTTTSSRLREHRRTVVELLFAEGNHVCSTCVANRACELQDLAVEMGVDHIRFDYRWPVHEVDASHPKYTFDPNRCVLCTRCVRTCDEIEGAHVWDVAGRGEDAHLVHEMNVPWGQASSCTWCGKCVAVCPTGALSFQGRSAGEMRHDPDLIAFLATARHEDRWRPRHPLAVATADAADDHAAEDTDDGQDVS